MWTACFFSSESGCKRPWSWCCLSLPRLVLLANSAHFCKAGVNKTAANHGVNLGDAGPSLDCSSSSTLVRVLFQGSSNQSGWWWLPFCPAHGHAVPPSLKCWHWYLCDPTVVWRNGAAWKLNHGLVSDLLSTWEGRQAAPSGNKSTRLHFGSDLDHMLLWTFHVCT